MIGRLLRMLLALAIPLVLLPQTSSAVEAAAERPLEYRRYFVPADRPQDWPKRNVPYLPIDRQEFDRLLSSANAAPRGVPAARGTRLSRASYQAKLAGQDLLVGEAHFELNRRGDSAALVNLDPFGLALGAARWDDEREVIMGAQPDGKLAVVVERAGTLICNWTLQGRREANGSLVFPFEAPFSTVCQLDLDLAESVVPSIDQGVETGDRESHQAGKWQFQLGGRTNVVLRLDSGDAHARPRRLALLQEKTTYGLLPGGIDVAALLRFDVHREPMRRTQLDLDGPLQVVSVQYAGLEMPWTVSSESGSNGPRLTIDFPEPLLGPARVVTVRAVALLEVGTPFKLPRLRVRDVAWQEGEISLLVHHPLALDALLPQGCRQTKVSRLSVGPPGDGIDLQLFSTDASVGLQVARRTPQATLTAGTTMRIAADSLHAELRGRIEALEGELFTLQAGLAAGWEVDSVTADRPGAIASWTVNQSARPALLIVQLAEPITTMRPLELMITAHRRATSDRPFSSATLEMVHFRDLVESRRWLALETSASQHIALHGPDWPRVYQRRLLNDTDRSLVPSALSNVILEVDPDRSDWNVAIETQRPRYSAEIRSIIEVDQQEVHESYVIRCQPDGSRIDQILVVFSQARDDAPLFLGDETVGSVIAERVGSGEQAAHGVPQAAEAWLLRFARTAAQAFEVRAERATPFVSPATPALAALPEAVSQQGKVEIRALDVPPLIESADRLEPVPPQPAPPGENASACATFRYNPLEELGVATAAALVLKPAADAGGPEPAHVWRLRLDSHYFASGEARHVAVFDIESHGSSQCLISCPAGTELFRVEVDGAPVGRQLAGTELQLVLPAQRQFPVAVIEFGSRNEPPGFLVEREAPWPVINLPITSREWYVSTAGRYELLKGSQSPAGWAARFLGPIGRRSDEVPFNPIRPLELRKSATNLRSQDQAFQRATKLLDVLSRTLATRGASLQNWGDLLAEIGKAEPGLLASLRVDARSLASANLGPSSPISLIRNTGAESTAGSTPSLADEALNADGLALMISGDVIMLTTRQTAIAQAKMILDNRRPVFQQTSAANLPGSPSTNRALYPPVSSWLQTPRLAWEGAAQSVARAGIDPDAPSYQVDQIGSRWLLRLIRYDVLIAAGWALAAVVFSLGAAVSRWRAVWLPLIVASAALAAVWGPPVLLPLAWGAMLGSLATVAWLLIRPNGRRSAAASPLPPEAQERRATSSLVSASLTVLLTLVSTSLGDESGTTTEAEPGPMVYRVFVPVDSKNKPGTLYQVPTDFLDELRRRANLANDEPRDWLITSAKYECSLARERLEGPLDVKQLAARYELQVLSNYARVRLPFTKQQVELIPDSATLDGQPLEMFWSNAGDALVCDVFEPGTYELEFQIRPIVFDEPETRGFDIRIPKVAMATLEVSLPVAGFALELPRIKGQLNVLEGGQKLSAQLGAVDSMVVRWPQQAAVMPTAEVEELLWLKVRPGSVVLDVTLNLNVTSGVLHHIEFAADRRLRLLPGAATSTDRSLPVALDVADAPQTTQLDLDRPLSGQASQRLSFLLSGASGVGNIRLPSFHTLNARVTRRWFAVTVDTGLEYEARDTEQIETLVTADFALKWGQDDPALRDALAYRLSGAETNWNLATRSREPQTTVKESLSFGFQRTHSLVRYEAQLMTSAGFVFQHRLLVPPDVEVDRVAIDEDGVDRVLRWSRSASGVVTVFLDRRITGAQQLRLLGRIPVRANGRLSLPNITLEPGASPATIEKAEVLGRTIHLYRQPSVRVALEDASGLSDFSDPSLGAFDPQLGRLVASHTAEGVYGGTIVVTPNEPNVHETQQFTLLRYANQEWIADVEFRFQADKGLVDSLRFGVPAAWAARCEVMSPASVSDFSDEPDQNRKVLTVRPLVPLTGECVVKLRAALRFTPGETVTAPEIGWLGVPVDERYWLLPLQVGIEAVSWDVQGLAPATLPDDLAPTIDAKSSVVFRAVSEHPRAVISTVKAAAGVARVRLADVHLAWSDERLSGVAAFDFEPGGHSVCPFELAAGWRLIGINVGGVAVMPLAQAPGKWEIPLTSNRLPQRLEAVFDLAAIPSPRQLPLPIVSLGDWTVEETLLTLQAPEAYRFEVAAGRIDADACDAARLASVVELMDLPEETAATSSHEDLAAWYRPWAERLLACAQPLGLSKAPTAAMATGDPSKLIHDKWQTTARRLKLEPVLADVAHETAPLTQPMEIWTQLNNYAPPVCYQWIGTKGPAEARLTRPWRGRLDYLVVSLWIGLLALVVVFMPRKAVLADAMRRWPQALGVALGLFWWLFCQPSAAGWLLIAWSLAMGLRSAVQPGQSKAAS